MGGEILDDGRPDDVHQYQGSYTSSVHVISRNITVKPRPTARCCVGTECVELPLVNLINDE